MLTTKQKYGIASMLATNTLQQTVERLQANLYFSLGEKSEAIGFAKRIDAYFAKRDGFVPRKVIAIVNEGK